MRLGLPTLIATLLFYNFARCEHSGASHAEQHDISAIEQRLGTVDISNTTTTNNTDTSALPIDEDTARLTGNQDAIIRHSNGGTNAEDMEHHEKSANSTAEEDLLAPTKVLNAKGPSAPQPPVPQVTGCRTQGQIALTFSEGPSDATAGIVRQLNHADARATFFVNASWLYSQQYAMVVQNTYNAGHFIGMTYRVKNDDSSVLTDKELRDDIIKDADIIQSLIQVAPKYVRLHFTNPEDTRTENIMKELGFILVGYNLDSQDYLHKPVEDVYRGAFQRYKETYDAKGSFISVQYDMPGTVTVSSIPKTINTISDEGYTMVRLDGCLNDPKPYKKSASSTEYVADKFSFNSPGYHDGQNVIDQKVIEEAEQQDVQQKDAKPEDDKKSEANTLVTSGALLAAAAAVAVFL